MKTDQVSVKEVKAEVKEEDPELDVIYRSGHLFIIDATPPMFSECGGEPESYFQQCLMAYERILRQKLTLNKDDWMGLMLFATEESDPMAKNIMTVLEFAEVSIDMLKELLNIIQCRIPYFESIASEKHYPLANVLLHAARAFDAVKIKMPYRQVVLLTCNDNPVPDDNDERHRARLHAKSYQDIQVTLKVVGFGEWDYGVFYEDLERIAAVSARVFKKTEITDLETSATRRATNIGNLKLKVGENYLIKVQLNALAKRRRYVETCLMKKETNEPLDKAFHHQRVKECFEDDEEEYPEIDWETDEFPKSTIRKCQRLGGRDILLSFEELTFIHKIKDRGIAIIKFEPVLENDPVFHIQLPFCLVIPAEAPRNERLFFAELLAKCKEKKVMAICAATLRENSRTLLFRMWPTPNMNGFYFYRIPYRDDVNKSSDHLYPLYSYNREGAEYPVNPEKLSIMEKVVKKFRIVYKPLIFSNPARSKQLGYLESLTLDEPYDPSSFEDYTQPAMDIFAQKLNSKGLLDQFYEVFPSNDLLEDDGRSQVKKVPRYDEDVAREMLANHVLSNLTVAQLKAILKALGLSCGGVKNALIERLEQYKADAM